MSFVHVPACAHSVVATAQLHRLFGRTFQKTEFEFVYMYGANPLASHRKNEKPPIVFVPARRPRHGFRNARERQTVISEILYIHISILVNHCKYNGFHYANQGFPLGQPEINFGLLPLILIFAESYATTMTTKKDANDMSFFEHLEELRPCIVRSVFVLLLMMVAAFVAKDAIMAIVMGPKSPDFPTNAAMGLLADATGSDALRINSDEITLINTSMAGQLNMHIMVSFYTALILSLPYILFELWGFVKPALTDNELKNGRIFFFNVSICMLAGIAFGYFVLAPLSVNFLDGYAVSEEIRNLIDAGSYISLVMNMSLVCALVFELPVLVYFLSRLGILTAAFMRRYRRHAVIILAAGAAIITPPDVISMILVIIPMYLLYELSIGIAARNEKRNAA